MKISWSKRHLDIATMSPAYCPYVCLRIQWCKEKGLLGFLWRSVVGKGIKEREKKRKEEEERRIHG